MKDFFSDPEFQRELAKAANIAREHAEALRPVTSVNAGDSFLFSESLELPVQWVAVLPHKDNPELWYLVAADDYPLVGSCDIELAKDEELAPLVLRCGVGFWAHVADIDPNAYVGSVDPGYVEYARDRLSGMVLGDVPSTESTRIADSDLDYEEWIGELSHVAEQIEARIQSEPVVLQSDAFDADLRNHLSLVAEPQTEYGMAADSVGKHDAERPSRASVLQSNLPGKLVAVLDDGEIDLLYEPADNDESPPPNVVIKGASHSEGEWDLKPDGRLLWSVAIVISDGQAEFRVGPEKFRIELP